MRAVYNWQFLSFCKFNFFDSTTIITMARTKQTAKKSSATVMRKGAAVQNFPENPRFPANQPVWVKQGKKKYRGLVRCYEKKEDTWFFLCFFPESNTEAWYKESDKKVSLRASARKVGSSNSKPKKKPKTSPADPPEPGPEPTKPKRTRKKYKMVPSDPTEEDQNYQDALEELTQSANSVVESLILGQTQEKKTKKKKRKSELPNFDTSMHSKHHASNTNEVTCYACKVSLLAKNAHLCCECDSPRYLHSYLLCHRQKDMHADMETGRYYCKEHLPQEIAGN